MKTFRHLLDRNMTYEPILRHYWPKVRKRKTLTPQRIVMEVVPMMSCVYISQCLMMDRWTPGPLLEFHRRENDKDRNIQWRPCVPDSIVQQMLLEKLEPVFKPRLILDTYSGLKGRGPSFATRRMAHHFRSLDLRSHGNFWIYSLDIHHYYQSIKPAILKRLIRRHVSDSWVLRLVDQVIDSYVDGLPFGDILSPLFANIYLSGLDKLAKEKYGFKCYGRYCDNIVVGSESKAKLQAFQREAHVYLEQELGLQVNPNEQIFHHRRGAVEFVGVTFNGHGMRLRKKTERRFRRAARRFQNEPTLRNYRSLASYWGLCANRPGGERFWNSVLRKPLKSLRWDAVDVFDASRLRKETRERLQEDQVVRKAKEDPNAQVVYYGQLPDIFSGNTKPGFGGMWEDEWRVNYITLRRELGERVLENSLFMPRVPSRWPPRHRPYRRYSKNISERTDL